MRCAGGGRWLRALSCAVTLLACTHEAPRVSAPSDALLPARVRRLSNVEYERTVNGLLGTNESIHDALPPDERQDGYTINERQALPSYYAAELSRVAERLAASAASQHLRELIPCAENAEASPDCIDRTLAELVLKAFRRPATRAEHDALRALFVAGANAAEGDSELAAGLKPVLSTLLSAPSLLYLSELGGSGDSITLTPYEIASSLAYAVSGTAPDSELLGIAAVPGRLLDEREREAQARRLLSQSSTRHHFRQFVLEWLEVDQLERTAKAAHLVSNYDSLRSHMLSETRNFVDEVMVYGGASLPSLLRAGFTSLDREMAEYYGIPGFFGARVRLTAQRRVGVLEQASFLSAHAYEDVTSPVKRGDFVLRRVLCIDLPRPGEVGIETVMPPRSDTGTTRQRFAAHTAVRDCQSCHASIDPLGFSFEGFDAAGRRRTREQGEPVTTAGSLAIAGTTLRFADSAELVTQLASLPESRRCFARQALRYWTGRRSRTTEEWFEAVVDALPAARRDSLLEWVVAWVRSPEFVTRRRPT